MERKKIISLRMERQFLAKKANELDGLCQRTWNYLLRSTEKLVQEEGGYLLKADKEILETYVVSTAVSFYLWENKHGKSRKTTQTPCALLRNAS